MCSWLEVLQTGQTQEPLFYIPAERELWLARDHLIHHRVQIGVTANSEERGASRESWSVGTKRDLSQTQETGQWGTYQT